MRLNELPLFARLKHAGALTGKRDHVIIMTVISLLGTSLAIWVLWKYFTPQDAKIQVATVICTLSLPWAYHALKFIYFFVQSPFLREKEKRRELEAELATFRQQRAQEYSRL